MPQLSAQREGWNAWYHLTATAYGQWLRGDPRGWRERHHRLHVEGDDQQPPPPSAYNTAIHKQSQRLLKHEPQYFQPDDREFIGTIFLGTFEFQKVVARVICVAPVHVHALVQCPKHDPEFVLGRSKQFVWTKFHEGSPRPWPKLWVKRPFAKPVQDQDHFNEVVNYILKHRKEGAWVWQRELGMESG